jgi:ribosomal-protein-alanine N-acetyltransferase
VRPSNIAGRKLYESLGFRTVGIRKSYYVNSRENVIVMELGIR